MLSGHDDGSIRLWNLETGTAVDLVHHTNSVTCLVMAQVSDVDQLLFSAGKPPAFTLLYQPHTWQVSQ
jgi:WD40 repeat protein